MFSDHGSIINGDFRGDNMNHGDFPWDDFFRVVKGWDLSTILRMVVSAMGDFPGDEWINFMVINGD